MRVGYVFESRFSAGTVERISRVFGTLNIEKDATLRKS